MVQTTIRHHSLPCMHTTFEPSWNQKKIIRIRHSSVRVFFRSEIQRGDQKYGNDRQSKKLTHYRAANCIAGVQYPCCAASFSAYNLGCRLVSCTCWFYYCNPWMWLARFAFGRMFVACASFVGRVLASYTSDSMRMSNILTHLNYLWNQWKTIKAISKIPQQSTQLMAMTASKTGKFSVSWRDLLVELIRSITDVTGFTKLLSLL